MSMVNNHLLIGTIAAVGIYWFAGFFVPDPYISSTASFALLTFGLITLLRYAPAAWQVIAHGKKLRDEEKGGSHLAVLGTAMLATGSVYVGIFSLLWVIAGQPDYWLGTPSSGFGRAIMAGGFWLMYASPDVVRRDMRVPGLAWLTVIVLASVLTGIFLGSQLEIK